MRVTGPLLKVLAHLLMEPAAEVYGLELARATGLKSGTLYPLLDRLEAAGWVTARWEDSGVSGPRRRFYSLTAEGVDEGRRVLLEHFPAGVAWA